MSNLLLLPGTNGHRSASQRREATLLAMQDHLMQVIAILVVQQGGLAMVSGASLKREYDLSTRRDPLTGNIVYCAKPAGEAREPLMPALDDAALSLDEDDEEEPT